MRHPSRLDWLKRLLALAVLLALAACEAEPPPQAAAPALAGELHLAGSSTMQPLVQAIAARFQSLHPAVQVRVDSGGSQRGIAEARAGRVDIGMAGKNLAGDPEMIGVAIARDGGALLLHRSNPVRQLSEAQVRAIFTGQVGNWRQVGGDDAPIRVIGRDAQRGVQELFLHYFRLAAGDLRVDAQGGDNAQTMALFLAQPNAIVFFSVGEAELRQAAGAPLKLLPAGGVPASRSSIEKGDYPLARPLTLVTRGLPQGLARAFIDYARSPAVRDLIEQHDFVPYLD